MFSTKPRPSEHQLKLLRNLATDSGLIVSKAITTFLDYYHQVRIERDYLWKLLENAEVFDVTDTTSIHFNEGVWRVWDEEIAGWMPGTNPLNNDFYDIKLAIKAARAKLDGE